MPNIHHSTGTFIKRYYYGIRKALLFFLLISFAFNIQLFLENRTMRQLIALQFQMTEQKVDELVKDIQTIEKKAPKADVNVTNTGTGYEIQLSNNKTSTGEIKYIDEVNLKSENKVLNPIKQK